MEFTHVIFWIILSALLGAGIGALVMHLFWRKKYTANNIRNQKTCDALNASIKELENQILLSLSKFDENQKASSEKYTAYISNFLEHATDKSDNISQELERVSGFVNELNNTVQLVNSKSEQTDSISDIGMQHVSKVAENLAVFSKSNEGLINIQNQFTVVQQKTEAIRFVGEEAEMLALNAAIEAARAGEAGRGFAVVAAAMKTLARNSQETTVDIQEIVSESEKTINDIVKDYVIRSDQFNQNVQLLLDSFTQIKLAITEISERATQIQSDTAESAKEILHTKESVKTTMETQVKDLSKLVSMITGVDIINLTPAEVKSRISDFDEIIDVRRPEEFNDSLGHIQNAKLSTLQTDFKTNVKNLDPNKCYLFVCRSGGRSTKAAQMAINYGVTKVFNLDGGMLAWNGK